MIGIAARVYLTKGPRARHIDQFIEVTVLQPDYVTGGMTHIAVHCILSIQESGLDKLPKQLPRCAD